jgi:hypothetical protein
MLAFRSAVATTAFAAAAIVACGGSVSNGGGPGTAADACDHYIDAYLAASCNILEPTDQVANLKTRFHQACTDVLSLPGANVATQLDACASAIPQQGCGATRADEEPCMLRGSLAAGSPCVSGWQCSSGYCDIISSADAGGASDSRCGTCGATVAVGQSCAFSTPGGPKHCEPGSTCAFLPPQQDTCVAVTEGDLGASCGTQATTCKAGLYCDPSNHCAAPQDQGAACMQDSACKPPLRCQIAGATGTCQGPGAAGTPCSIDAHCVTGLGCAANQCTTITWASGGQPCSTTNRCLVGSCLPSGTCPAVVPDGQACDESNTSRVCETLSACVNGTCQLTGSFSCH